MPRLHAGLWGVFTSLPQPLFAVLAFQSVDRMRGLLSAGLGFASGAMGIVAFELAGEAKFRSMERDAIHVAADAGPSILSTGGGSICTPETADLLCERTFVVWLDAKPETLLSRISSIGSRPLLHTDDPLQTLRELAETRQADYGRAHITVKTDRLSAAAAVNAVLDALDSHLAET